MPLHHSIAPYTFQETLQHPHLRAVGITWSDQEMYPFTLSNLAIWLRHLQTTALHHQEIVSDKADYRDWLRSWNTLKTKPASLPLPPLISNPCSTWGRQATHQATILWGTVIPWLMDGPPPWTKAWGNPTL
jgi:hypothetical protein